MSVNQQACLKWNCHWTCFKFCSYFQFSIFFWICDISFSKGPSKKLWKYEKVTYGTLGLYVWLFYVACTYVKRTCKKISLYITYIFRVNGMNEMHTESIDLLYIFSSVVLRAIRYFVTYTFVLIYNIVCMPIKYCFHSYCSYCHIMQKLGSLIYFFLN